MSILLTGEDVKFAKQGWGVFDTGDDLLQIQRIDDPKAWTSEYTVPLLDCDEVAYTLAQREGFILNPNGQVVARLKNKFGSLKK